MARKRHIFVHTMEQTGWICCKVECPMYKQKRQPRSGGLREAERFCAYIEHTELV